MSLFVKSFLLLCMLCVVWLGGDCSASTDILLLLDTSYSMDWTSDTIKDAFNELVSYVYVNSPCAETIQFGVADYSDYNDGGDYQTYGVRLVQPFTDDLASVLTAIYSLSPNDGGGDEESQLKAMVNAADNWLATSGDLDFGGREDSKKIIVWCGDYSGHVAGDDEEGSPPANYYPTLEGTIEALTDMDITVLALNLKSCTDGLNKVYDGHYQASEITDATGGKHFCNSLSIIPDIADELVDMVLCYNFIKVDDLNPTDPTDCRSPGQTISYQICWSNDSSQTLVDAYIIDYLPAEVIYYSLTGSGVYDSSTHAVTWDIGNIASSDADCVTFDVIVNNSAEPMSYLHNLAEFYATVDVNNISVEAIVETATEDTLVCCWGDDPNIIYVDQAAVGFNNGTSWQNAYTDLADAIERAGEYLCSDEYSIYVAQGTYNPENTPDTTFEIPADCSMYGGFPSGGCEFGQRNPVRYETVLTGLIDEDTTPDADTVVTMGDNTMLDGFTVEYGGYLGGVSGNSVTSTIENCVINNNTRRGINYYNGNLIVKWCVIVNNGWQGIFHTSSGNSINIENSIIYNNLFDGIYTESSVISLRNSQVFSNGSGSDAYNTYYGINVRIPSGSPEIHNNTIVRNTNEGICFVGSNAPDIRNCILWYNNTNAQVQTQIDGIDYDEISYCCVYDYLDPNNPSDLSDAYNNIDCEPEFAYIDDPNGYDNFHLAWDSPCIDLGDSGVVDVNDVDMDNEDRIYGTYVDIGADEVFSCDDDLSEDDIYNPLDWAGADGIINLYELNAFSRAWLTYDSTHPLCDPYNANYVSDPNDPNYISISDKLRFNEKCDYYEDLTINISDISEFAEDWLWEACWHKSIRERFDVSVAGIESMAATQSIALETVSLMSDQSVSVTSEPEAEEQIDSIEEILVFLDELWKDKEVKQLVSKEQWEDFVDTLEITLYELKNGL